jgi:hypothetical protein
VVTVGMEPLGSQKEFRVSSRVWLQRVDGHRGGIEGRSLDRLRPRLAQGSKNRFPKSRAAGLFQPERPAVQPGLNGGVRVAAQDPRFQVIQCPSPRARLEGVEFVDECMLG